MVALAAYHRGDIESDKVIAAIDGHSTEPKMIPIIPKIASCFPDVERRAAFQISWYYRHPNMPDGSCFKCNAKHTGQTCAEFNEEKYKNVDVKFCPRCGVATQKSFACDHIICICGYQYHWQTLNRWGSS